MKHDNRTGRSHTVLSVAVAALLALPAGAFAKGKPVAPDNSEPRPIQLGVTGSSLEHIFITDESGTTTAYCYSGTLGSLVTDGSFQYILSNNHVLAKENYPDQNPTDWMGNSLENVASVDGYKVIQPSLGDAGGICTMGDAIDVVATTSHWVELDLTSYDDFNTLGIAALTTTPADAAIAIVETGAVNGDGRILQIGTLASTPVEPEVGMLVQKTGRTSGHTFGTVTGIDVEVLVGYDGGVARFEHQVAVQATCAGDAFGQPGDSGSAIINVPDGTPEGTPDRAATALLFAGTADGTITFATPMSDTLEAFASARTAPGTIALIGELSMVTGDDPEDHLMEDDTGNLPKCKGGGGGGRGGGPGGRPRADIGPVGLAVARDAKAANSDRLFAISGVVGHAVGADANGNAVINVFVEKRGKQAFGQGVPSEIDGVPTHVIQTGRIIAY